MRERLSEIRTERERDRERERERESKSERKCKRERERERERERKKEKEEEKVEEKEKEKKNQRWSRERRISSFVLKGRIFCFVCICSVFFITVQSEGNVIFFHICEE